MSQKTEITIDNQYVTKIIAQVYISPRITKRKGIKSTNRMIFLDSEHLYQTKIAVESTTEVCAPIIVL